MSNGALTAVPGTASSGRRLVTLILGLVLLAAWLAPLGYRDLMETDEGRYAEISREMVVSGDWVTPRLNDLKYFEKPPLQYWATATIFQVAGQSTFTARLYTALCALLCVLAVWRTAARLWGREAGSYAAMATASMVWMIGGSQVPTLDMSLTLYLTLTLCCFLIGQANATAPARRRWWMLAMWASLGAAVLTKGLVGLLIPGATLFIYSLLHRDFSSLKRMEWALGLPLFLLLTVPWFALVSSSNPEFAQFFFIHEHLDRYLTTQHQRDGALWYFVPLLLVGALPWTPLLPLAAWRSWRDTVPTQAAKRLLLIWCGFIFVFFSLSSSKLSFYILPMFPAIGLLLGPMLADVSFRGMRRTALTIATFWLLVGVVAPVTMLLVSGSDSMPREIAQGFAPWVALAAAVTVLGASSSAWLAQRERRRTAVAALATGSFVGLLCAILGFQAFSESRSTRQLADEIRPLMRADTQLFVVKTYYQTLPFYLGRTLTIVGFSGELELGQKAEPGKWIPKLDDFRQRWQQPGDAIAVAPAAVAKSLQTEGLPMEIIATSRRRVAFRKPSPPESSAL